MGHNGVYGIPVKPQVYPFNGFEITINHQLWGIYRRIPQDTAGYPKTDPFLAFTVDHGAFEAIALAES